MPRTNRWLVPGIEVLAAIALFAGTTTAWPSRGARMEPALLNELSRLPGSATGPQLAATRATTSAIDSEAISKWLRESGKIIMYGHIGVTGTLAGTNFADAAYQGGSALGLTMYGLAAALTVLTLLFAVIAILGLLPKLGARS